ncbi:MAG TPA: SGNH/GDSL hydrolase family protein [Polyangiaceae bacterium]|nr:SGNH/GDSL hydrolase family protein [Polyangiaceae bacterium]
MTFKTLCFGGAFTLAFAVACSSTNAASPALPSAGATSTGTAGAASGGNEQTGGALSMNEPGSGGAPTPIAPGGSSSSAGRAGATAVAGAGGAPSQTGGAGAIGGSIGGEAGASSTDTTPIAIAVLGASSAAGKNLPEGGFSLNDSWVNRYLARLSFERPGSTITNLAMSGYSFYQALPTGTTNPSGQPAVDPQHNVTAALATNPDALIVAFPSQALVEMGMADEVIEGLQLIVATAAAKGVPTWVATNQPNKNTLASTAAQLSYRGRVMATFGERALDFWTPLADANGVAVPALLNPYDSVHPSGEGHRVLFEQVLAADLPGTLAQ